MTLTIYRGLWNRFTVDTAGTGTGFVIHQDANGSVTKSQSTGGHLRTTASQFGNGQTLGGGGVSFTVYRGRVSGEFAITAASSSAKDFSADARALKVRLRGNL